MNGYCQKCPLRQQKDFDIEYCQECAWVAQKEIEALEVLVQAALKLINDALNIRAGLIDIPKAKAWVDKVMLGQSDMGGK
jgi:hypothetical protein